MQYTPGDILNYVYEKELDTQFLLATANHVQDFSIGEITDKKIEKRGEDFYLISRSYHLDIKITDDEVLTAAINGLYISAFISRKDDNYRVHFLVHQYPDQMKARFEEKLRVEINVEDGLSCQVPSFILQPIVENAVRYGNSADGMRRVEISAKRVQSGTGEELVRIGVRDHGKGFEPEEAERILTGNKTGSVGLKNVNERLKSTYGKRYGLEIRNTDDGAEVSFCIPYQAAG